MNHRFSARPLLAVLLFLFSTFTGAQVPEGYYSAVDVSSPTTLRESLHEIIDDHLKIPYTASELDTWDVLETGDQDQDQPGNITTLYRNNSAPKQGGGNSFYNREHSWPRSYGFTDDSPENYPFSDMHALFLADIDYNAERQNQPYGNCDSGCRDFSAEANDGRGGNAADINQTIGEFSQGSWDVWPQRRGDVARAQLYMDLRYAGGNHGISGATEPDLILTDDRALIESSRSSDNEPIGYMGLLSTLLEWHEEDPVDDIERQHHEAVFAAQGNRNPFIDNPQFARCVFAADCAALQRTIPNVAGLSGLWFDPEQNGAGYNVIVSSAGITVFFYGYSQTGERLWLISDTVTASLEFEQSISLALFEGDGGSFGSLETAALQDWGTLTLRFDSCSTGQFRLSGTDGDKISNVVQLAAIQGLSCDGSNR